MKTQAEVIRLYEQALEMRDEWLDKQRKEQAKPNPDPDQLQRIREWLIDYGAKVAIISHILED